MKSNKKYPVPGLWVPRIILMNAEITYAEKLVLAYVLYRESIYENGECSDRCLWESDETLASKIFGDSISKDSMNCLTRSLANKGYLYKILDQTRFGSRRYIWANMDKLKEMDKIELKEPEDVEEDSHGALKIENIQNQENKEPNEVKPSDQDNKKVNKDLTPTERARLQMMNSQNLSLTNNSNKKITKKDIMDAVLKEDRELSEKYIKQAQEESKQEAKAKGQRRAIRRNNLIEKFLTVNNLQSDSDLGRNIRSIILRDKRNTHLSEEAIILQLDMLQRKIDSDGLSVVMKIVENHVIRGYQALIYENELSGENNSNKYQKDIVKEGPTSGTAAQKLEIFNHVVSCNLIKDGNISHHSEVFLKRLSIYIRGECPWDSKWKDGIPNEFEDSSYDYIDLFYKDLVKKGLITE